jgi:ATPase subunit of ABC transporter with duplicated ATPase domains
MRRIAVLVASVCLAGGIPVWSGTKSLDQAEKVARGYQELEKMVAKFQGQLAKVSERLNELTSSKGGDLKEPYSAFEKESKKMRDMAREANKAGEKATKRKNDYLKAWEKNQKSIQNETLQAAAKARRDELSPLMDRIRSSADDLRDRFAPFVQDLTDIETYLGNDLSPAGLVTVQPLTKKCTDDAKELDKGLDELSKALRELAMRVAPGQKK